MHRIQAIYGRQADPERFIAHYTETHLGLAGRLPGLISMHHSFEVQTLTPTPEVFCIWAGDFADAAAADAALTSPEGQALAADMPNYVSGEVQMLRFDVDQTGPAA